MWPPGQRMNLDLHGWGTRKREEFGKGHNILKEKKIAPSCFSESRGFFFFPNGGKKKGVRKNTGGRGRILQIFGPKERKRKYILR